ncbi:hypothetical protein GCM10023191_037930 [Actinoallomurus oryzae]|uniref:Uncharacterized protein n=1 Tax=Actinoallomurus oryzae TaxID=502180 RepID=A0ABP8Q1S9_9ACTN
MPGLAELTYTTLGGVVGAAASGYLTRHHERRQLRAAVMQRLHAVVEVTAGVRDVELGRPPVSRTADGRRRLTDVLGVRAVLGDGTDAEHAQREAFAGLTVAALAAGVPRRVTDFAAGSCERTLECTVIALADRRVGGVLGDDAEELVRRADEYQRSAVGLLLHRLWHPWRARPVTRRRIRDLRVDVGVLDRHQQAAREVLTRTEHVERLSAGLERGPVAPSRTAEGGAA